MNEGGNENSLSISRRVSGIAGLICGTEVSSGWSSTRSSVSSLDSRSAQMLDASLQSPAAKSIMLPPARLFERLQDSDHSGATFGYSMTLSLTHTRLIL
jgi:hypothetical protein